MLLLSLLTSLSFIFASGGHVFMYYPTNKITHLDNWQNHDKPCKGDHLVFEEAKNTLAFFDESILVDEMLLPQDGALYFADNIIIPKAMPYQCERRKSPEDVFFDVEKPFASFFNPANWEHDHEPMLHMNMVPGEIDEVYLFNHTLQIYFEEQAKVSALHFEGKEKTSEDFDNLMHTVEGQFRVSLGHNLARKYSYKGVEFSIPNKPPIIIQKKVISERDERLGLANPNMEPETLRLICQYVTCPSIHERCVEPVKPVGHCCFVCGAVVNFTGINTNRALVWDHFYKTLLDNMFHIDLDINLERLEYDAAPNEYQLTIIPSKEHANDEYNEDLVTRAVYAFERVLDRQIDHENFVFHYEHSISIIDRKIRTGSKVIGFICGFIVLSAAIMYVLQKDTNIRFNNIFFGRGTTTSGHSYTTVIWRRGASEDHIQLVNPNHEELQGFAESEEENGEPIRHVSDNGNITIRTLLDTEESEEMTLINLHETPTTQDKTVEEVPLVEF